METVTKKQEWIERYKNYMTKKTAMAAAITQEMAENAFDEFGEDSPEESVDSELLKKKWHLIDTNQPSIS